MRSDNSVKRLLLSVAVIVAGGLGSVGLTAPTSAAAASGPGLQVSVVVTPSKASYAVGDAITTTFVVTNTGTTSATNVRLFGGDEDGVDRQTSPPADKFDLAPGESHSVPWAGTINQGAEILGYAFGGWSFTDDSLANSSGVLGKYHIGPVPGMTGTLSGKVFVDLKANFDESQPGLAGVTVTATDFAGKLVASTTTDQTGQFSMPDLAAGAYEVRVVGWTIEGADASNAEPAPVYGGSHGPVPTGIPIVPGSGTPTSTPTATPTSTPTGTANGPGSASASASSVIPRLPVTGSPTGLMAAVGAGLVLVGVGAVVAVGRRRRDGGSRAD